jgi:hypothetical protein
VDLVFIAANFFQKHGKQEWARSVTAGSFYDPAAGDSLVAFTLAVVRGPLRWKRPNRGYCLS